MFTIDWNGSFPVRNKENMVYQGDCLEIMAKIPSNTIDLTVTSCPYDQLRTYNQTATGPLFDYEETLKELYRITTDGGVVCWNVADQTTKGSMTGTSFRQALSAMDVRFKFWQTIIYAKPSTRHQHDGRYLNCFEYVYVFLKGNKPRAWHPLKKRNKHAKKFASGTVRQPDGILNNKEKFQIGDFGVERNIWELSNVNDRSLDHPAIMPEVLALGLIYSWTNEGDVVFDPFVGSGTSCVAAKKLNRQYIGCDVSGKYIENARERLKQTYILHDWEPPEEPVGLIHLSKISGKHPQDRNNNARAFKTDNTLKQSHINRGIENLILNEKAKVIQCNKPGDIPPEGGLKCK